MTTIKSYTDLEQSKVLAKFLPLDSADMWWNYYSVTTDDTTPQIIHLDTPWAGSFNLSNKPDNIPCWSLVALLHVMPDKVIEGDDDNHILPPVKVDNLVDACYDAIIKLHELKLL